MLHRRAVMIVLILAIFANPFGLRAAFADACLHAPAPILAEGDAAIVAPNLGPLNLRLLPAVSTGIAAQLYGGSRVTVIGQPSCNGEYTWLRVEVPGGRSGWIAQGDWNSYWLLPADMAAEDVPTPFEFSCMMAFSAQHCL